MKEFNKTDIEGENALNSILDTWGKDGAPFSFCELGNADYKYDKLIEYLKIKKDEEKINFQKNKKINYNFLILLVILKKFYLVKLENTSFGILFRPIL